MQTSQTIFHILLSSFVLFGCNSEKPADDESVPAVSPDAGPDVGTGSQPTTGTEIDPVDDVRLYVFGNSLVVHEHTPEPTEEKKVPHWMALISNEADVGFSVDGRYGFMRNFANFDEIGPQWGFEEAESEWTDETQAFSEIDYNRIIFTPTNFVQWQGPAEPYYDDPSTTPLSTTLSTMDQIAEAHPGTPVFIYEGWADMAGYGEFPGEINLDSYYEDGMGDYHDWFLDYHDRILRARPELTVKMIPVNLVLSKLFTGLLEDMSVLDRYEDDAPHGQPSVYFLASLITWSAMYQSPVPENLSIPETVHSSIRNQFLDVRNSIWLELQNFNHEDGSSRVF